MKKHIYIISSIIGVSLLIIFLGNNIVPEDNEIVKDDKKRKIYSTGISMMLETSAGSGEYLETTDTTWAQAIAKGYIFNETMSKCENGSTLTWNETNKIVEFTGNVSDKCYVYFDVKKPTAAETITNLYTSDGVNGLYKHDGVGTYGTYEAVDNSYRYTGADPNNYVCFGTSAETCPDDNMYRIIGIFNGQIKLIKKTMLSSTMTWDSGDKNTWSTASLNTYLNGTFLTNLGTNANKIATHKWQVGGNTWANIGMVTNAKTAYQAEMVTPATADTVDKKIGLMYVNDYRYAADPAQANAWSALQAYNYNNATVTANNWMYMNNGNYEWTITRQSDNMTVAFSVFESGCVVANYVTDSYGVRPSFYLESNVEFSAGTGTSSDPYRISI